MSYESQEIGFGLSMLSVVCMVTLRLITTGSTVLFWFMLGFFVAINIMGLVLVVKE